VDECLVRLCLAGRAVDPSFMSAPELRVPATKPAWFSLFGGSPAAVPFVRFNLTVAGRGLHSSTPQLNLNRF